MQNMKKDINAAEVLGVGTNQLNTAFKERQISEQTFNDLKTGKFIPYFPSEDIEAIKTVEGLGLNAQVANVSEFLKSGGACQCLVITLQ